MLIRALASASTLPLALLLTALFLTPSSTHAQTPRGTVVVPVRAGPRDESSSRTSDPIDASLARRGVGLISMHEARDRFVARSRAPMGSNDADVDVLAREAHDALEHVAFGRTQAAQRSVKEVLARAERALESLNRETETARQVLDACLALVRSALQTNDRRAALDQATSCRRLVPDVAPNHSLHPASVIGVLAEADDQLRRLRTGHLKVVSVPESACAVYLNGRHLGVTPFVLERAVTGPYRVQVECSEERGRVHLVELGDEPAELRVDTQLDHAIASEPRLALHYPSRPQLDALAVDHATQIGRAVRAENVVLVRAENGSVLLSRVAVDQARLIGQVRIAFGAQGYQRAELEKALDAMWEGRIDEPPPKVAAAEATASKPPSEPQSVTPDDAPVLPAAHATGDDIVASPKDSARATPAWKAWTGGALAVVAAGTFASGVFFEQQAQQFDDDLAELPDGDPAISTVSEDYDRAKNLRWIGLGGALSVGTVALLAKSRPSVPWWSYVITGAGVALAGVSIYELATADRCELTASEGFCVQTRNSEGRGMLMLTASAPLLSVLPTHFLLRGAGQERATIGVFPDRHGARAVLSLRLRRL